MPTRPTKFLALTLAMAALASPAHAKSSGMRAAAERLFASLTPAQRAEAARPFDDPARSQELFPGGKRVGIQLRDLTPAQHAQALELLTSFTSDYGRKKADLIAAQEGKGGLDQYYLAFFGTPGEGQTYAWRIAEHHLTIVDVEVRGDQVTQFGPILLGANPPTLWNDEEDSLIDLYKSLTPDERTKASRDGKSDSAKPIEAVGIPVPELSDASRKKVQSILDQRLDFYSPEIRRRVEQMIERQGGLSSMRIAFWGTADKRCADGGRWDFKLGGDHFLCDYENTRGHIHLSMKGSLPTAASKP